MAQTVIGIFDTASQAQHAVEQLVNNGFTREQVDISNRNAYPAGNDTDGYQDTTGSFFRSLLSDDEAGKYAQVARQGSVVTVHSRNTQEAQRAANILDQNGAVDVDERARRYAGGTTSDNEVRPTSLNDSADTGRAIPIVEEELQLGKREVETGGVRLRSRIIEQPVEEHLRLREEHVHVERNPVNRPVAEADLNAFKEQTIEMTERAEVPVVNKEARVVEEVKLHKDVETREETVRDTVRRTDVDVQNMDKTGSYTSDADRGTDADDYQIRQGVVDTTSAGTTYGTGTTFSDTAAGQRTGTLRRMKEIEDDYEVADDNEDVRGWNVVNSNGDKIGEVKELIVDMDAMKVRYLDVELDDDVFDVDDDYHVLIPVGVANLDQDDDHVVIPNLDQTVVTSLPAYRGEPITREYEHRLLTAFSPGYRASAVGNNDFYQGDYFRTDRFHRSRTGSDYAYGRGRFDADGTELRERGNWNELKGKMRQQYADLTDDDLEYAHGKEEEWYGRLSRKLGRSVDDVKAWVRSL